jgi:hypothetical protein
MTQGCVGEKPYSPLCGPLATLTLAVLPVPVWAIAIAASAPIATPLPNNFTECGII